MRPEADNFLTTKLVRLSTILLKGLNKSESERYLIQKPTANFASEKAVCGGERVSTVCVPYSILT